MRNLRISAASRHALVIAFALLAAAGAAAPAGAECSGPDLTMIDTVARGGSTWPVKYVCRNNCAVQSATAPVIEEVWLYDRYEMLHCRSRCSARPDCAAVAWRDTTVLHGGEFVRARICVLYGRGGSLTTTDYTSPRPINYTVVCQAVTGDRNAWGQDGVDRPGIPRDQYRPGVPGPSVPKKP